MGNYMGMIPEETYGEDLVSSSGGASSTPQFHIQTESHNPGLNDENQFINMGEMAPVRDRKGYAEPTASATSSADGKSFGTFMYYLLGNYRYHPDGYGNETDGFINVHEFWGGKKRSLPSCNIRWATDGLETVSRGNILSSLSFTADSDITKLESEWVYKTEKALDIDIDDYTVNPLDIIPFIGYDWTVTFETYGSSIASTCEVEIDNNINTDNLTVLGSRFYARRPKSDGRSITLTVTGQFDEEVFDLLINAMYGEKELKQGYYHPSACKTLHDEVRLHASTCEESNLSFYLMFPYCAIELESPIEATESASELKLKITPLFKEPHSLYHDSHHGIVTDIYCRVLGDIEPIIPITSMTAGTITSANGQYTFPYYSKGSGGNNVVPMPNRSLDKALPAGDGMQGRTVSPTRSFNFVDTGDDNETVTEEPEEPEEPEEQTEE